MAFLFPQYSVVSTTIFILYYHELLFFPHLISEYNPLPVRVVIEFLYTAVTPLLHFHQDHPQLP